jgi:FAD/FMN-containing dehydrogenase
MRPGSTNEVALCLAACNEAGQPVVVQGGRTGFQGGERARAGEAILSLERMTSLSAVDVESASVEAEAGVVLQRVQEAADEAGFFFGVDIGSRGSATIGGNIASNAGGIRVLRYGMFRAQISGLEAVLADGTVLSSMRGLTKDNAGYDLKQLFIGSEGTLGVVTRARLALHPKPAGEGAAFCAVASLDAAIWLLTRLRETLGPLLSSCEIIFSDAMEGALAHTGAARPVARAPCYVLAEIHARDAERDAALFADTLIDAHGAGVAVDIVIAQSIREFRAFWALRDACSTYVSSLDRCIGCDLSLPAGNLRAFVTEAGEVVRALDAGAMLPVFGHLGDGNLHYIVQTDRPDAVVDAIHRCVQRFGGSIAAEHGIGADKKAHLHLSRSSAEIAAMRRLKRAFDPNNILNPGRVFDLDPEGQISGAGS